MTFKRFSMLFLYCLCCSNFGVGYGDGPADNRTDQVRPIPPAGIEVPDATIEALAWRCKAIRSEWQTFVRNENARTTADAKPIVPSAASLESEVLVFPRAVELAIEFGQFYKPNQPELASQLLDEAARRLNVIKQGGSWADVVGLGDGSLRQLIIGGFRSSIDGSYQPYGLEIPTGLSRGDARPRRLDVWLHGRGETLSEVAFLSKQRSVGGQYSPADTIMLHPYGRYSNAFKFAGEIDVLEALEYIRGRIPVDPNRISIRGFSMGGAGCWQFATHHADRWFAANPGAGFSETPEFLAFFQKENVRETAPEFQQTLWQLYDCPPWAPNLVHCPTVAYSGEVDRQKQAADVMEAALRDVGIDLMHVIGPQTAHKIHAEAKVDIESRMAKLAQSARNRVPRRVSFTTLTLRYHRMHWIDVQGLGKHWVPAQVDAVINGSRIDVSTRNVTQLRFSFDSGQWSGNAAVPITVVIDGTTLRGPEVKSDLSWKWELSRHSGSWKVADNAPGLRKRPHLQGPIDDAFMDSFLFVLPSGTSPDKTVQGWVERESNHAMIHWRKHFRGDILRKLDTELTDHDITSANLVLFGDPDSNQFLRRIESDLPIRWRADSIQIGGAETPRQGHAPALIFPNPLNPDRYVVLNSGFTFREYDYLNNARQTPKLPDWALIDVRQGASTQLPGIIKAAGFFDETWKP